MAKQSYSVTDIATGVYIGVRGLEPFYNMAAHGWDMTAVTTELRYRFGGIGSDGKINLNGAIQTYLPPVIMQVMKKLVRGAMGKSIRIGPLRVP